MQERSANEMLNFLKDPGRLEELKANPLPVLEKARDEALIKTEPAYIGDKLIYRIVVSALGLAVLIAAVGGIVIVMADKVPPDMLVALGSAAVGALAGLLAPSPTSK
jgi:hypothetical protein